MLRQAYVWFLVLCLFPVVTPQSRSAQSYDDAEAEKFFQDKVITFHNVHIQSNYKEENITYDRSSKPKVNTLNMNMDLKQDVVQMEHLETTTKEADLVLIPIKEDSIDNNYIESDNDVTNFR